MPLLQPLFFKPQEPSLHEASAWFPFAMFVAENHFLYDLDWHFGQIMSSVRSGPIWSISYIIPQFWHLYSNIGKVVSFHFMSVVVLDKFIYLVILLDALLYHSFSK
jgi:hypothetical protein